MPCCLSHQINREDSYAANLIDISNVWTVSTLSAEQPFTDLQEIDYTLEGESADRFRKNFGKEDWLKVPRIFWERTTSEVLTMEYCPGVKINRIPELDKLGVDRKRLAKLAVESYLQQILTYGFFHAGMVLLLMLEGLARASPRASSMQVGP